MKPPGGVRIHIAGIDLIRSPDGVLRVLEDNLRTPSGVSYVVENRLITKRIFPKAFDRTASTASTTTRRARRDAALGLARAIPTSSTIVVLTPGPFNSAYFEHSFLARTMGIELVQAARPLRRRRRRSSCAPRAGPRRVHVIYRRIDDAFLDPEVFRPDSLLGVPGLMRAYAAGQRGARQRARQRRRRRQGGLPLRARHDPLLPGRGARSSSRCPPTSARAATTARYVLEHLGAGGQGRRRGGRLRHADGPAGHRRRARRVPRPHRAEPRRYIAQHRVELSTCPTWIADRGGSSRGASICGPSS